MGSSGNGVYITKHLVIPIEFHKLCRSFSFSDKIETKDVKWPEHPDHYRESASGTWASQSPKHAHCR